MRRTPARRLGRRGGGRLREVGERVVEVREGGLAQAELDSRDEGVPRHIGRDRVDAPVELDESAEGGHEASADHKLLVARGV